MKIIFPACLLLARVDGFAVQPTGTSAAPRLQPKETQTLGLLTFDLDDTRYPIAPVEAEANEAFVKAMELYGFKGLEKDDIVKSANASVNDADEGESEVAALDYPYTYDDRVWIHVGDDLAFDVGGSAACGAKTVYAELAEKYDQSARFRFDGNEQPSWSTTPSNELKKRYEMSKLGEDKVDATVHFLTRRYYQRYFGRRI